MYPKIQKPAARLIHNPSLPPGMSNAPKHIVVSGAFDDLRARDLRFLELASRLGKLSVLLWPDALAKKVCGCVPKFPLAERYYFLSAVRWVSQVRILKSSETPDALPKHLRADIWADCEPWPNAARKAFCRDKKILYRIVSSEKLNRFPLRQGSASASCAGIAPSREQVPCTGPLKADATSARARKKVIVTGAFDWLHSGHVRFFEEASALGDLFVIIGHDSNVRLLKGAGHPLLAQRERCYAVGSIKYVTQALVSTGHGWLDAAPEIERLNPDIYAVNEDGDKGGKREYCQKFGIEYVVLERVPAPGLPPRTSTILRGF
ncbi:MAG: adenylyltransferase/cytidyltransferase family protein [Limisphaerales bacterium]